MKLLQALGVFVLIVAAASAASTLENPCICTMEYEPVCGTDGQTYPNKCALRCAAEDNPKLEVAYSGMCIENSVEMEELDVQVRDPCICTRIYLPVCGSDGHTYGNECELNCVKSTKPGLSMAHEGECHEGLELSQVSSHCICIALYAPVCGSDGHTYGNECELNCAKSTNPDLSKVHDGECQKVQLDQVRDPCICTRIYLPECGSDGQTYPNECELNCAKSSAPGLHVAHHGECQEKVEFYQKRDPCICTKIFLPECGSDGLTYPNECELNCAKSTSPGLHVAHHGACQEKLYQNRGDPCICTRIYLPECGSDGQTYPNECELNCAKASAPGLHVAHHGACQEKEQEVNDCMCPMVYSPVCGSDGKTYSNPCEFRCVQRRSNCDLKMVHKGPCKNHAVQANEQDEMSMDPCVCNKMLLPVCGSDGKTYSNPCVLRCARATENHDLTLVSYGPCVHSMFNQLWNKAVPHLLCACNKMYWPVCGSDGQTYANKCLLKCATKNYQTLKMVHEGPCTTSAYEMRDCDCGDEYRPVCAKENGKYITFGNVCKYACVARENPNISFEKHVAC